MASATVETLKCKSLENENDFIEGIVCKESDIKENEMKQYDLGDSGKILLIKQNGQLSAIGTKCTHYGAPLSTGALGDGRVRCPWHGACFNIKNGDIEDFPGLDSLPCYKVSVEKGQVKVRARKTDLDANKRSKRMAKPGDLDGRSFIIIGGGPSAAVCVETLRHEGFTGRIVMVCKEPYLPYDRIKLSKAMDSDISKLQLRTQDFYDDVGIETMLGVKATSIDTYDQSVILDNGYVIKYDKVYIATGSRARHLNIPGHDLRGVFTLRNLSDARNIMSMLNPSKHVVVLGISFIGLEVASYVCTKVAKVTIVGRDNVPLKPVFGEEIGQRIMDLFKEKGIEFIMNNSVTQCNGNDDTLTSVDLTDGQILKADVFIMGTGSTFYTDFLKESTINRNRDGSITTDMHLETNIKGVYAGGDIANAPIFPLANNVATIGHYSLAQYHGKIAALNMVGKETQLKAVPFFWTVLFGKSFRYSGYGKFDSIRIEGDLNELKFFAFYFDKNDKVIAVASCMRDPLVAKFAELQSQGKALYKNQLEPDPFAWAQ